MTPKVMMEAGNEILGTVLESAGFALKDTQLGHGSGGDFAVARWTKGAQFIEVHCRFALGIVRYGWEDEEFDHSHVVGALGATTSYPGFSGDPLDGFRHLAQDLAGPLSGILADHGKHIAEKARNLAPTRSEAALSPLRTQRQEAAAGRPLAMAK